MPNGGYLLGEGVAVGVGAGFGDCGVKLDEEKNATRSKEPRIISTPDSSVIIAVIPTNEELAIARKSAAIAEAVGDVARCRDGNLC